MSDMNIRNIPDDLVRKIKMVALMENKPLREKVIEILEQSVAGVRFDKVEYSDKKESNHE